MNWTTDYPPNATAQPQTQIGQNCIPVQTNTAKSSGLMAAIQAQTQAQAKEMAAWQAQTQTQTPKPMGLMAAIQALTSEVHEAANLAKNIANSLGLSTPQPDTEKSSPQAPIELLFDAMTVIRAANDKLTGVLQHINS